jgi:hypothetical protein
MLFGRIVHRLAARRAELIWISITILELLAIERLLISVLGDPPNSVLAVA